MVGVRSTESLYKCSSGVMATHMSASKDRTGKITKLLDHFLYKNNRIIS